MKEKDIAKIKSAVRHFAITAAAVWVAKPDADWKAVLAGVVAAIVGPAIRGLDKADPAFGIVADKVATKIKLAATSKKTK
jgi:hypothetical protein